MKSMLHVPAALELIEPSFNQSFRFRKFEESEPNLKPFWHYHPEIELVYVNSGSSKRHIGNHISEYKNGDLILLGPNLPHYGFTDRLLGNRSEIVVQMKSDFLGQNFFSIPEMKEIKVLLHKASAGIVFHTRTRMEVGEVLESISEAEPFDKLMALINVFRRLAVAKDYELLNTNNPTLVLRKQDNDKIDRIYKYIKENFKDDISLKQISTLVSLEIPSFCRYFKRVTGKTFTEFVNEFRVTHACKLISETELSIAAICFESGFNNSSHFNRLFKSTTGKTPLEYREEVAHLILA